MSDGDCSYEHALGGLPDGHHLPWFGQIFLLAAYGFILFKAAVLIGDGSEKLLLLYGPGVIGGLVIPILGAVPDGAIVLVSGLGPDAQQQVKIGVGTLAGSTIILLTVPWALSVFLGARDRDPQTGKAAKDPDTGRPKFENGFSMTETVVTTYSNVPFGAKAMMLTALSYFIVAIPAAINKNNSHAASREQIPALVGIIVCGLAFCGYCIYQLKDSHAQTTQSMKQQKLKFNKWKETIAKSFGDTDNALRTVFDRFDKDGNGVIDRAELFKGFQAMGLECDRKQITEIMREINTDDDEDTLSFEEFKHAVKKWARFFLNDASRQPTMRRLVSSNFDSDARQALMGGIPDADDYESTKNVNSKEGGPIIVDSRAIRDDVESAKVSGNNDEEDSKDETGHKLLGDSGPVVEKADSTNQRLLDSMWSEMKAEDEEEAEEMELELTDAQIFREALFMLFLGTALVVVFSDPMVAVIGKFSNTIDIPAFYVSFIVTPLASNAAEIYSSLIFARKKTTEGISLGFSALYGAACMNNTFVLCIFCVLVYVRKLKWTFLVETLVILLTIAVVGVIGLKDTVSVWQALLVLSLFPLSLVLVAVLTGPMDD